MSHDLARARSFLFVPGNRPDRYIKALESGSDAVIIDLEDAVAREEKQAARTLLAQAWASMKDRSRVLIRVNGLHDPESLADIELCRHIAPVGLLIPKVEEASAIASLHESLGQTVALLPMLESAAGWDNLPAICRSPGVLRLAFGHIDFQVDLGMACADDEVELTSVRFDLVVKSRLAGIAPPIDGVTVQIGDMNRLKHSTLRAKQFGFTAKLCIHPAQVAVIHENLAPNPDELLWAKRVLDAARQAGGAAVQVDGKMVDRPVIIQAERLMALAGTQAGA